jgi:hypothetical protein
MLNFKTIILSLALFTSSYKLISSDAKPTIDDVPAEFRSLVVACNGLQLIIDLLVMDITEICFDTYTHYFVSSLDLHASKSVFPDREPLYTATKGRYQVAFPKNKFAYLILSNIFKLKTQARDTINLELPEAKIVIQEIKNLNFWESCTLLPDIADVSGI